MATTNAKDSSVVGKDKRPSSSNSHIPSTKRTNKPSMTTSSTAKATTSTPSEKQAPSNLRPKISPRLESHSFRQPKSDAPPRPTLNRRRSFDKPPSPSSLPKQNQHSLSRQHKALNVSPGPRDRSLPLRSSSLPVKSTYNPSKPISERTSKTSKMQPLLAKSAKRSSLSVSISAAKKVLANDASANSTKNAAKSTPETAEALINVETEPEVKEAINEEVEEVVKVEDEKHEVEYESEVSPHVDYEHEHAYELEESDHHQHHIEADDEKVIPTVSEEEAKDEPREEKTEYEHEEHENNINQDEYNIDGSHPEKHSASDEGEVEVKENEEEGGPMTEEDHKSENKNNEEEAVEKTKEGVEGGISDEGVKLSEGQDEDDNVKSKIQEAKDESTKPRQKAAGQQVQGKKESQSPVSNDVIEETASKLILEARKNKVRALAGAFQSVIDYQTTSK